MYRHKLCIYVYRNYEYMYIFTDKLVCMRIYKKYPNLINVKILPLAMSLKYRQIDLPNLPPSHPIEHLIHREFNRVNFKHNSHLIPACISDVTFGTRRSYLLYLICMAISLHQIFCQRTGEMHLSMFSDVYEHCTLAEYSCIIMMPLLWSHSCTTTTATSAARARAGTCKLQHLLILHPNLKVHIYSHF